MDRINKSNKIKFITHTALIAAAYAALTYAFAFMSYGQVQFRVSEILVLFALIEPRYGLGLVLGCVLANMTSTLGVIDIVVGSFATLVAVIYIIWVRKSFGLNKKSLYLASLGPVVSNAIFVGLELTYLFQTPFLVNAMYVALGELVVVTVAGTQVVNVLMENSAFSQRLSMN
ncbi:MAG: QueT transporter family protein [Sedimentibacter sp.]|uniref:QueT transporter family protein n=1 Tax=Sedimentibacter sp. TaxID=1960295 RepID=UPI003158EF00